MKKEKTIRTYQRRTKTGKVVTVKQHTAKYDAAEALKEAAKKKGAGEELDALKKKSQTKPAKEAAPKDDALGFTADEYKAWYHWDQDADPKNAAAKKVEKALKAKMGAKGYKKYFDEMTDSYSSRGHNKAFKALDAEAAVPKKDAKTPKSKVSTIYGGMTKEEFEKRQRDFTKRVKDADKGTRAKYSFTDIKKKIKEADISDAARKRLLKSINKPYAVVTPAVMEKRLQKELDKKSSKSKVSELSSERVGNGVAFKDNRAGRAWAEKNGEPVAPFGKEELITK